MGELFTLFIGSVLINNIILNKFLGILSFHGCFQENQQCAWNGCSCNLRYLCIFDLYLCDLSFSSGEIQY